MKRRMGIATPSATDSMEVDQENYKGPNKAKLGGEIDRSKKNLSIISKALAGDNTFEEAEEEEENDVNLSLGQNSRRAFLRELRKVVEKADVIINVLDARDPIGTRSKTVEEMVSSNHRKRLVYVLNKADLVPKDVLVEWLEYLRQFAPTIPFKSNTQNQKDNLGSLGSSKGKVLSNKEDLIHSTSQAIGVEEILNLLKNYCRLKDGNQSNKVIISVGIVGFPNVGKSSLINSLMRSRSVGVSSMPGFTKTLQEVILDKNIRLIDSPGVVFSDENNAATVLRNCVNIEEMVDVITPVKAILERCPQEYLMQLYNVPRFPANDSSAFLALVAKTMGKLKKGGIPNIEASGKTVLHDWNNGKIKFYCKAPKVLPASINNNLNTSAVVTSSDRDTLRSETQILTTASEGIDLDNLLNHFNQSGVKVLEDIYKSAPTESNSSDFFVPLDNITEMNLD